MNATSKVVWLNNADGKLSSLFPSYLMRAFRIDCSFTQNIEEANVIVGGRNLLKVPEHFSGIIFGAGLDRKAVRCFPLTKIVFMLGYKSGECVLSRAENAKMHMGDPLLLADIVRTRLGDPLLEKKATTALLAVPTEEEAEIIKAWPWVRVGLEQKELVLFVVSTETRNRTMLEILDLLRFQKFIVALDPDIIAVAMSFNVPCAPATMTSKDAFMWRDLYSVLSPKQQIPLIKRLKGDLTLREVASWCQTMAAGELIVLKSQLQQHFNIFRPTGIIPPTAPAPKRGRSRSVDKKPPSRRSTPSPQPKPPSARKPTPTNNLASTMPFIPTLKLDWRSVTAAAETPSPPESLSASSFSSVSSTTKSLPLPQKTATTPRTPSTARSVAHIRSKSTVGGRRIISHATP